MTLSLLDDFGPETGVLFEALAHWLAAEPAERVARLAAFPPGAGSWVWEWANAGPTLAGDYASELALQGDALELAAALAERDGPAELAVRAALGRARLALHPERAAWNRRALAAAAGHPLLEAEANVAQALSQAEQHAPEQALESARAALAACARAGEAGAALADELVPHLSRWALEGPEPLAALPLLEAYETACRARGDREGCARAAACLGAHWVALGRMHEARPRLEAAVALWGELDEADELARAHLHLLTACYWLGDPMAAMASLEALSGLAERVESSALAAELRAVLPPDAAI